MLASMVTNFLIKCLQVGALIRIIKLAQELHKPIIKKFKKRTIYSGFKDNIWVLI